MGFTFTVQKTNVISLGGGRIKELSFEILKSRFLPYFQQRKERCAYLERDKED